MNRKPQKNTATTPFDRETERRRREMLRNIGGYTMRLTPAFLRGFERPQRKYLLAKPAPKAVKA